MKDIAASYSSVSCTLHCNKCDSTYVAFCLFLTRLAADRLTLLPQHKMFVASFADAYLKRATTGCKTTNVLVLSWSFQDVTAADAVSVFQRHARNGSFRRRVGDDNW